jgi:hypothetical protein
MHAEQPFAGTLGYKAADFSSGVRVQFKAPLDPIARVAACHRPETEIREGASAIAASRRCEILAVRQMFSRSK